MTNCNYILFQYNNVEKTINQRNNNKQFSQREITHQNNISFFKKGECKK